MKKQYLKKYWDEEQILFYFHFEDGWTVRQIEVSPTETGYFSLEAWKNGGRMICDQPLESWELDGDEFISEAEFEEAWAKGH